MTPAEKEQLYSCVGKLRSMPWKGPRGGVYNWTDRELRNLYKKLVVYGESNQPTAVWRLLNQGKYKYMIYPWYRAQLYNCTPFKPPCIYTSYNATGSSPTGFYSGIMTITDLDTNTVLASDTWENAIIALQNQGYNTWGGLQATTGAVGNPASSINFTLLLYINTTSVPNWSVSFSGNPQQTLVFGPELCTCNTNASGSSVLPFVTRGATLPSECEFISAYIFSNTSVNIIGNLALTSPIVATDYTAVENLLKALQGPQIIVSQINSQNGTAGLFYTMVCNQVSCTKFVYFRSKKITSAYITSDVDYQGTIYNCTVDCLWYYSFSIIIGSGDTIDGLPADDPVTWTTLATTYGFNTLAYPDMSFSQLYVTIIFSQDTYISLPDLYVLPSGPYIDKTSYNNIGNCATGCMEVIIPAYDQYMDKLSDITTVNFLDITGGMSLDLGDNVTASSILTQIYSSLYGPACYAIVDVTDMFDWRVTIYNAYSPGSTLTPYLYSNMTSLSYTFTQIACP